MSRRNGWQGRGRKTGGRKRGSRNKRTAKREAALRAAAKRLAAAIPEAFAGDAHAYLMMVYKNPLELPAIRIRFRATAGPNLDLG